jgi:septum formation protein
LTPFLFYYHYPQVMEKLLLASSSPRRKDLLESLGLDLAIIAPDIDETIYDCQRPRDRVIALAMLKARAVARGAPYTEPRLILGADTLVCVPESSSGIDEEVLGKPVDRDDARRMIVLLSGRVHCVHTGLALIDRENGREWTARSDSTVGFSRMDYEEIETYLDSGEWEGVAGAYRIQGRAAWFIERIEGSWSGIVGLPIRELYGILKSADFRLGR